MSYEAEANEELHAGDEEYNAESTAELYKSAMAQASQPQQPPTNTYGSGYMPGQPGPTASQPGLHGAPITPAPGFTQAPYGTMGPAGAKAGYSPVPPPQQGYPPQQQGYPPYGAPMPPGFATPPPQQPAWSSSQTNLVSPGTPGRPVSGIQFPVGPKGQQVNVDSHEDDF